jgi:hypothetical protein
MDEKFTKIITDFTNDLLLTFPELKANIDKINSDLQKTYDHCIEMFPKIFFEILYENNSLFEKECFLLPGIDFTLIMKDNDKIIGISDKTKKTIWKYLQLILFSVLEKINTNKSFGETSKIFEGIEENELHKKIAETMEEMKGLFMNSSESDSGSPDLSGVMPDLDPEKMKSHLDDLMNGKIGTLAKEIAEEAKNSIGDEKEFMETIMKNPQKILSLVKNIGGKLEEKISSGQVKESELLEEATQIMDKIQDIPGLKEMMAKMGLNGKMDFKAMANKMQQHMKGSKTKERLQKKRENKMNERNQAKQPIPVADIKQTSEDTFVVKIGESPQKSSKRKNRRKNKNKDHQNDKNDKNDENDKNDNENDKNEQMVEEK